MAQAGSPNRDGSPAPPRWGALALGLLFALSLAFQLGVLDEKFLMGDEGIALGDAWRISRGELPHRDYFEIVPPLSFLPTAAVFKLFGVGLLQARLLVLAYSLLLLFLVDRALRLLGAGFWGRALALAFLTPFGLFYWPVPSHHWVADLFLLGAGFALLKALEPRTVVSASPRWALAAGICTALCGLSLQDQGGYLALATALGVLPWIPKEGGFRRRVALAWAAGLGGTAALAAAILLPLVGAQQLLYQWLLFPATRYKGIGDNATGAFAGWEGILSLWSSGGWATRPLYSALLTLCVGMLFALPLFAAAALAYLFASKGRPRIPIAVLSTGALACFGAAAHRWAITNAVWAAPALLLPVGLALERLACARMAWLRAAAKLSAVLATAALVAFAGVYYAGSRRYATAKLQAPAGTLRSSLSTEVRQINRVIAAVGELLPPGAPLFCDGYLPLMNLLTLHPNPTRYQFLSHPGYHTDAQAREVVEALRAAPGAWVLLTKPIQPAKVLDAYAVQECEKVWESSAVALYRQKAGTAP